MRRTITAICLYLLATGACALDVSGQALERPERYLQIDTNNPPGNESRGVTYLAGILQKAGIPYETGESAPGRGNLWARLPGGDESALVLLHRIDVVPAAR